MLKHLSNYSLHYCLRPELNEHYKVKPFTKGFTASAVGAVVMANKATEDAVEFLGADYPYLTRSLDADEVVSTFERAKQGFRGTDWKNAQDVMQNLNELVSPAKIASQFREIVSFLEGSDDLEKKA